MFFYSYNIPIRNLWDILKQCVCHLLILQPAGISMQSLFRFVAILRGTMVTATIKIIMLIYFYFRRSRLLVAEEMKKNLKKTRVIKIRKLMIKVKQLIQMQQQYQQFVDENTPPKSFKQKNL